MQSGWRRRDEEEREEGYMQQIQITFTDIRLTGLISKLALSV